MYKHNAKYIFVFFTKSLKIKAENYKKNIKVLKIIEFEANDTLINLI